ncbi:LemA family protein [Comamonas flocculans]|uniref:LemA family protein n=1 Tax=Comamonas flocculans TaxID=2597701 RepID=A0A5B8RT62_9BURK|nr:LemA family protein [Comamonas flocculans]QEA12671.1 LemA family protein [Comamonas flocculans]
MSWMHVAIFALAIAVFWMVGAYNRLVRQRAAVLQAFGALDAFYLRWITLTGECLAALREPEGDAGLADARAAVDAATGQLGASLAVARARPLDGAAIAALGAGTQALAAAWQGLRQQAEGAPQAARTALALWGRQYEALRQQSLPTREAFNAAVQAYNAAIGQFPANVLAWLFSFRRSQGL